MSYHVEAPRFGFKELPERILVRENGAYGANKENGEPIIDYWYVPEQAIAATLGAGTCHDIALEGEWFECSECRTVKQLIHPKYCPNCGRKVVDE